MLENDTLKNGISCIGLYGSSPPLPGSVSFHSDILSIYDIQSKIKQFLKKLHFSLNCADKNFHDTKTLYNSLTYQF